MDDPQPDGGSDSQQQLDELTARVAANRSDLDDLQARVDSARRRADESEARADKSEARADDDRVRIDGLEVRADVDRRLLAELQADGTVSRQHAAHLEAALRSSRRIGAAIGIVMAVRDIDEDEAFEVLKRASSHANRKLRDIAEDVVRTGDVGDLPELDSEPRAPGGAVASQQASSAAVRLRRHHGLGS